MRVQVFCGEDLAYDDDGTVWSINGPWLVLQRQDGTVYLFSAQAASEVRVFPDEEDD